MNRDKWGKLIIIYGGIGTVIKEVIIDAKDN